MNPNFNQPLVLKPKSPNEDKTTQVRLVYKKRFSFKKIILLIIFGFLIYALVNFGLQIFHAYQNKKNILTTSQILESVGKSMVLPTNETPIITTINNPDEVNYQPFFMNALAGDQVIVYKINKKAILYRPSTDKIIEAATLQ